MFTVRGTEDPLSPRHLTVQQFVTDRRRIAALRPHRAANGGQQNSFGIWMIPSIAEFAEA